MGAGGLAYFDFMVGRVCTGDESYKEGVGREGCVIPRSDLPIVVFVCILPTTARTEIPMYY